MVEQHITPIVLVAMGHDHQEGKLYVFTTEEITDEEIVLFLAGAMQIIASGEHHTIPEKKGAHDGLTEL
jgi:hypothetical protein